MTDVITESAPVVEWVANARLQSKNDSQRKALAVLNRRVRAQRLQLRVLNELGRGLTADEYLKAKAKYADQLDDEFKI